MFKQKMQFSIVTLLAYTGIGAFLFSLAGGVGLANTGSLRYQFGFPVPYYTGPLENPPASEIFFGVLCFDYAFAIATLLLLIWLHLLFREAKARRHALIDSAE